MNTSILNRSFLHPADGWYHIEAKGEHPNRAAGVVQIIDDAACESIVAAFNRAADAPGFPGMLIDHEHFQHNDDKETTAYGWLERLQNRPDGVYGQIRWTRTGREAVDGGDYRFFSTEYAAAQMQVVHETNPRQARPLALAGLTLTNVNNNKGQKPITNRGAASRPPQKAPPMNTVRSLLGLSAEASEEAVHAEVARALNRIQELEKSQVETDLELYQNRFDPKQRDFIRTLLVTNRAATVEFLKSQPLEKAPIAPARLHNRRAATPVDTAAGGVEADPAALSAERNTAIMEYRAVNRCGFHEAYDAVRRQKPALFGLEQPA